MTLLVDSAEDRSQIRGHTDFGRFGGYRRIIGEMNGHD